VALAVAIIMTPAAAHRQISAETMSRAFIMVATRLLLWSMLPLALGICLDFDLVGRLILGRGVLTTVLAAALFLVFVTLWFLLPRMRSVRETLALEE